jgi:dTDP-4-dehydrorhamnose reductase
VRIFVVGSRGQIARSLREAADAQDDILFEFGARPDVDLLRPDSIEKALASFRPDIVINPAAYTAVDKAEIEIERAFAINREGAEAVATAANDHGAPIIHLSTDYVFDGRKNDPYIETDPTAPLGIYGKSKLEREQVVAAANPHHIVLRTCWVYAPFGNNLYVPCSTWLPSASVFAWSTIRSDARPTHPTLRARLSQLPVG